MNLLIHTDILYNWFGNNWKKLISKKNKQYDNKIITKQKNKLNSNDCYLRYG